MKLSIPNFKFRIANWKNSPAIAAARRQSAASHSPFKIRHSQFESGIALVITLILLSVTLVMALAFLAVARRERNSVTTTADTTTARLAADTALAAAQAQIMANILATNAAAYNYGLLVSTNYINYAGFNPADLPGNVENVNYDHYTTGGALNPNDFIQNIANLYLLPRAPVLTTTDTNDPAGRFYLDLNRNGVFDANNDATNYDSAGNVIMAGLNPLLTSQPGDPEWIGVLEHPDQPHSPDNPFVARYAFIAQPIGNALDLNYIHNQTKTGTVNPAAGGNDGYFRNEGVGSWELNLAAFLADLNTNEWNPPTVENAANNPYIYQQPYFANRGVAFEDALSLLSWRYANTYNSLAPVSALFANGGLALQNQPFDIFPLGLPLTATPLSFYLNNPSIRWAGADNTNRFFSLPSDLFGANFNLGNFPQHLQNAGSYTVKGAQPTYDRYTFYRLLDQLGTESTADSGKMNLNYDNLDPYIYASGGNTYTNPPSATNLMAWTALGFFTNAADRMLRTYTTNWFQSSPSNYLATYYGITNYNYSYLNAYGYRIWNDPTGYGLTNVPLFGMTNEVPAFGITNIPVYVNGQFVYSPAVNRVLQLAANMYDASTNSFFPSVFRPYFSRDIYGSLYITGYTNVDTVSDATDIRLSTPFDASQVLLPTGTNVFVNVYGVPWIIGAKKGFPSFNKFGMQDVVQITRKLQVARKVIASVGTRLTAADLAFTNQLYAFSISNTVGVECWNSYSNSFPDQVYIHVRDSVSMWITNSYGLPQTYFTNYLLNPLDTNVTVYRWPGYTNGLANSFIVPLHGTAVLLTNADFYFGTTPPGVSGFYPESYGYGWETHRTSFDLPQFGLITTNRFQLFMLDGAGPPYHVIDYVQFAGPNTSRNLNSVFQTNSADLSYDNMWSTYPNDNGVPYGVANQWDASLGKISLISTYWKTIGGSQNTAQDEIDGFCEFLGLTPPFPVTNPNIVADYTNRYVVQVPYTPTATIYDYVDLEANDPLVHYMSSDMINTVGDNSGGPQPGIHKLADNFSMMPLPSYSKVNMRYQPWGLGTQMTNLNQIGINAVVQSGYNLTCKDPQVWSSDFWDFPDNKYPTVGWIGRVHRGTPWQTVYLKAHNVLHWLDPHGDVASGTNTWGVWTGNYNNFDAANSAPLQDRLLFDLFTTSLNDNATRGTLSVNVGADQPGPSAGLAAWSALFSGMVALTNNTPIARLLGPTATTTTDLIINPAGAAGDSSALGYLVTNINYMRSLFVNPDGVTGTFEHKGDILSVAALTEQSPFINTNIVSIGRASYNEPDFGISDEVYEWLPQQMMGLLRGPSASRYVVYCYGQTLKPAPNGLVLGGSYFGLCTNYQITAESAARAIIRVEAHPALTGTNYTTTVESYNVLPPN
jgi:hypothetical protein